MNTIKSTLLSGEATASSLPVDQPNSRIIQQHYLITTVLRDTPKGSVFKCLYIKGFLKNGLCILKSGKKGANMDNCGRDMKDKLKWQEDLHRKLQYLIPLPRLLDAFEYRDDYYIAISYVNGVSLSKKVHEVGRDFQKELGVGNKKAVSVLSYLIDITKIVSKLHQNGYVHRDITVENFMITRWGRVFILDLELAYSLNHRHPYPPHQLGTHGYMSPEQLAAKRPTVKEDIFSLGALLFKTFTGIDPNKVLGGPAEGLQNKIRFFIKDAIMADMVASCLAPDPIQRPAVDEIRNVLVTYRSDVRRTKKRPAFHSADTFMPVNAIPKLIQEAIDAIVSPLMVRDNLWFSERMDMEKSLESKMETDTYPGFSRGVSGVLYLLSVCRSMGYTISSQHTLIDNSVDYIYQALQTSSGQLSAGLHFGEAGIAVSIASIIDTQLIAKKGDYQEWIISLLSKDTVELGFMHGITGMGLAILACSDHIDPAGLKIKLFSYTNRLKQQQNKNGSWHRTNSKGKPEVCIGFANGCSGIIWFLLECYEQFRDPETLIAAEHGLQYLVQEAKRTRNARINWNGKKENEMDYWWCEGTPGIALAFLKAFKVTQNPIYKLYATIALHAHDPYIIDNNLTQCHGLAGLGEIYLEAYSILKEEEWRERASWIVQVLIKLKIDHPKYGPYWLTQKKSQPVADFMIGNAGIVHFLIRYLHPEKIGFPLLPA